MGQFESDNVGQFESDKMGQAKSESIDQCDRILQTPKSFDLGVFTYYSHTFFICNRTFTSQV